MPRFIRYHQDGNEVVVNVDRLIRAKVDNENNTVDLMLDIPGGRGESHISVVVDGDDATAVRLALQKLDE